MKMPHVLFKWNWSWGFTLFIALPAIGLAIMGMRAVRAERIEQEQKLREQEMQIARLTDEAIRNQVLSFEATLKQTEIETASGSAGQLTGIYRFVLHQNDLQFPNQNVFFGEQSPPQWPPNIEDLIEQAQAAKTQGRVLDAFAAYDRIS